MAVGALLSGIIAPLVVHSLLNGKNQAHVDTGGASSTNNNMDMMAPTFNVNFYNQDVNNNQDQTDVKDNGNLNYQQGNSHQTAQGNLHNSKSHLRFPQEPPLYPYQQHHPSYPQGYPYPPSPYPYYHPYAYPGYPGQVPFARPQPPPFPVNGPPSWPQPSPVFPPQLAPFPPQPIASPNSPIAQQVQHTSKIIENLLQSINQ